MDNRRKYYRHQFTSDLCGEMSVVEVAGKQVLTKKAYVCIKDIGAGGIRFESHLKIPTREDVTLEISTVLLGKKVVIQGKLSRIIERTNGFYEYGLRFIGESDDELSRLVSEVSMKARKTLRNTGCSLCSRRTQCHKVNSEFKLPVD